MFVPPSNEPSIFVVWTLKKLHTPNTINKTYESVKFLYINILITHCLHYEITIIVNALFMVLLSGSESGI